MRPDGSLDLAGLHKVVAHLLDTGHDGVVVNGTTGESATTSDDEKDAILRAALGAVGDRGRVVAGVGSNDTAHTLHLAHRAVAAGAHGLLVVTPYYNKPTQAGLLAHFTAVADAVDLPVMLYDIPGRTGTPITMETLLRLADHPRIAAVKDAKGDLWSASRVLSETDLLWFSGDDAATLAHLTQGATGYVGVTTHVAGATSLPVMLYDIPGRSGRKVASSTLLRLAHEVPNIVALKDAAGDPVASAALLAEAPDGFELYSGDDSLTLPLLAIGASGVVGVATHWAGPVFAEMVRSFEAGDVAGARACHRRLLPTFAFETSDENPYPVPAKAMMRELGFPVGPPRLPHVESDSEALVAAARRIIDDLGLTGA